MNRKITNFLRFFLDELLPPILRDNKYFMYPLFWIWYKGKNVEKLMEFKSRIHEISHEEFCHYYEIYDSLPERETDLSEESIQFIYKELNERYEDKIIDVGCGSGYLLKKLKNSGFKFLHGFDIQPPELGPEIQLKEGNVESLPYADNEFDTVMCHHMIEHVLHPEKTISELKRIAKKKLIITIPRQRYYRYTFELHINFYPQESYALRAIDHPKATCQNIGGDWSIVVDLEN